MSRQFVRFAVTTPYQTILIGLLREEVSPYALLSFLLHFMKSLQNVLRGGMKRKASKVKNTLELSPLLEDH